MNERTIQYQGLAAPLMPPRPQDVGAGWMGSCLPPTRRKWAAALTIAACVLPSTFAEGSPNAPTSWRPTCPDQVVRKVVLTSQRPFYFSPEVINANPGDPGGAVIPTGSLPILQYQSIAAPFNDTPAPAFTDQIFADRADIVNRPKTLHASLQQFWAFDQFDAPTAAGVTALSWSPQYPGPTRRLRQTPIQAMDLLPTFATFIDLNWRPIYPSQHLVPRTNARYIWPHPYFIVEVDVPVMSWTGLYLDPPVRRKAVRQPFGMNGSLEPSLLPQPTAPPQLSWEPEYPDRLNPARRPAFAQSQPLVPLFIPDQTNPVTALSWSARFADRVFPRRSLLTASQQAFMSDKFTAPAVVTAPDLSAPVYPHRIYAKAKAQWAPDVTAPHFVPDVTQPVRPLSWDAQYPDRIWPPTSLLTAAQLALIIDARIAPPIVPITLSRHKTGIPRRQRAAAVTGYTRTVKIPRSKRDE
jgi:hypothetical protein